ncbi:MAG: alpha/beta hydrolase [Gemmatimonadaceae bacterium]|nr:alpha/beta hydrolase [Gemmatimonadaceae bacterium]
MVIVFPSLLRRRSTWVGLVGVGLVAALGYVASVWAPDVPVDALKAKWAPPPSQFLPLRGMMVHVRDEGPRDDSLPVLLVHGTSASLHTWDGWADSLRATRRVIRFDLPGFGLTGPSPDGDYTMDAYVRTVIAVLDTLGVRRAVIGGNSLGGGVAWHVAVAHPDRVAKLILVDAVGYPFVSQSVPIGFRLARIPVLNVLIQRLLPRSVVEQSVRNVVGDPARITPELIERYYDITRREGNRAALVARFRQSGGDTDTTAIRRLAVPTLILWGERDRLIPPDNAARFGRDIAGSRVVMYPTLGHVPHEEDPAATLVAVREFLGAQPGAR